MGTQPDQIRAEIEATRAQLGDDLDQLTERINPGRVAARRAEDARQRVTLATGALRREVESAAESVRQQMDAHPQVAATATRAKDTAGRAATATTRKARANPRASAQVGAAVAAVLVIMLVIRHCRRATEPV